MFLSFTKKNVFNNKNNTYAILFQMLNLVLVKHNDTFLFLEGIMLKGIIDKVPEFGDAVPIDMENLLEWALTNSLENPVIDITRCKPSLGQSWKTLKIIFKYVFFL